MTLSVHHPAPRKPISLVQPARTRHALLLIVLLAACGGGAADTTKPVIIPPAEPASLTVSAGDGQEAEVGAALSTPPAVVVRSANGSVMSGVAVAFVVDSGGGTIGAASATTNSSGIASPGAWTVGPAAGPQVLRATVVGLQPVKIRALARAPSNVIGSGIISSSGGTITVNMPASPFNGTTLILPAGSVTGATTVTLTTAPTTGISLPREQTTDLPSLVISSTGGALTKAAKLHVKTPNSSGENTLLVAYNRQAGTTQLILQQRVDSTGVTAMLSAFDASASSAPEVRGALWTGLLAEKMEESQLELLISRVPPEVLTKDYDSQFLIGRDFWDFTNFAVAWLPFLPGTQEGSPATKVMDMGSGMVATSLWYFNTQRDRPLNKRFRLQADQPASNKVGIRWAALASQTVVPQYSEALREANDLFKDVTPERFHWSSLVMTKQLFYDSFDKPVPILLYPVASLAGASASDLDTRIAIATKIVGNEITIIVPENSDFPYVLKVTRDGGLEPKVIVSLEGESFTVRSFIPVRPRPLTDAPAVASNWSKVVAGTVGDAEGWPTPELHWKDGKLDVDGVYLAEPLKHFWECASCPDFGVAFPNSPENAKKLQGLQVGRIVGGAMAPFPSQVLKTSITWSADSVTSDVEPNKAGHAIFLPQAKVGEKYVAGWLDWKTVTYRKISLNPSPATVTFSQDTTVNFTLSPSQPFPPGTTFSWVYRTDEGRDSVATTGPTHARDLKAKKPGKMLIIAHEKDTKRPIARDSVEIKSEVAGPFWQLKTFVDEDDLLDTDDNNVGIPFYDMVRRLLAQPQSGLIAIEDDGDGKLVLRIRVLPSTIWTKDACCPLPLTPFPGEFRQSLGVQPSIVYQVGPFFSGWGTSQWSQTSTDLNTGTMAGQFIEGGTILRAIKDKGSQYGPADVLRFTATRNGKNMTGSIRVYGWGVDPDTREITESIPEELVLSFTAVRLK